MNAFEQLYGIIGEVTQGGKTYATAPTPPVGDASTKVATTAWVKDSTPSIPSGNVATWSRAFTTRRSGSNVCLFAPTGGSWFCWGSVSYGWSRNTQTWSTNGVAVSGGATLHSWENPYGSGMTITSNNGMALKIA